MQQVDHFWELIIGTVIALLPIINPLAAAPSFLAITEGDSRERRLQQLRHACFYMVGILVSFLIGGTFIMSFFGISIPGLRIAGGFLVAGIGSAMLLGAPRDPRPDDPAEAEAVLAPKIHGTRVLDSLLPTAPAALWLLAPHA